MPDIKTISPLVRTLLNNRGLSNEEDMLNFLSPDWERDTHNPFAMHDMEKAVKRVLKALQKNEKIVIYSDYDTDGVPGAVILHDFFKKIGHTNFSVYIPHRVIEGFGLNEDAIDQFIKEETNLLITIDCGIRGNGEVEKAQRAGMDVIITDHHTPGDIPPKAYAIVNPKMPACEYNEKMLCGAGVIFKLVQALIKKGKEDKISQFNDIHEGWEKWLLDMAGIATLSDMVPLTGENRALAHFGLTVLRKSRRPGLKRLLERARVSQKYLSEEDVGFTIGPRINAASRMGIPMDAFKLLSSEDVSEAEELVKHLEEINNERKGKVASIVKEIHKKLSKREQHPEVIATGDPSWSPALMGLVANSVVETYKRPAFIWGRGESSVIKGSCRGTGTVNLVHLMENVPENFFIEYGGHADSGGFAIDHEHIHTLEKVLSEAFLSLDNIKEMNKIRVDAPLSLDDVTWNLWDDISQLAPFGVGNPRPLFAFENILLETVTTFGKQKNHLKLILREEVSKSVEAIEFFKTPDDYDLKEGERRNVLAHLEKNTFGYRPQLRLRIVDVK